ncbi:MAG: transposase [Cyanobacteriota bacterium]
MITLTYEYKLAPTLKQTQVFDHWLEICRSVWNFALRERKDWVNSRKCDINFCSIISEYLIPPDAKRPTYASQCKALTAAKKEYPQLKIVHSQVLQQVLKQLETAFVSMWERGFGFPRFKNKMRSFVFPQMKAEDLVGDIIKLPSIGTIKMHLSRPIPDGFSLKQARIVKRASGYYVMLSLQCDVNVPDVPPHGEPLGIDVGLVSFVATSSGELVERPRFFVDAQSKLKLLQRRASPKKKGSKNWRKVNQKIALLHEHISNSRKNWHFKLSHHLCNQAGIIFVEELNLKAMSRGMLCKHTLDAGFGQFLNILSWVCWKRDVYFAKVDCRGTSQTCPVCDTHSPKDLSVRVHDCICGYRTDRDVAAAQVVKKRGLLNLNAAGLAVFQNVCGAGLTGIEISSQEALKQKIQTVKFGIPR